MGKFITMIIALFLFTQPVYAQDSVNNVRIAIIDTGISTLALDSGQIAQGKNYILPNENTEDKINHGTAIASLILGKVDRGLIGAYPEATLVPIVYFSIDGNAIVKGDASMLAKCIYDAVDAYSCRVINLSAGVLNDSKELIDACDYAEKKGVVIVSAVGNDNQSYPQNIYFPAAYDAVIGVGAIDNSGEVALFSQRNSSVDVVAKGKDLWVSRASGRMTYVSGTSYSTAFVSATVARILSENPNFSPEDVRNILYKSADDLGKTGYDIDSGYGALNIEKAMELAKGYSRFTDIPNNSWYYNAVNRIDRFGFIKGTSKTQFSPELITTKAMVLTILYRLDNEPNQSVDNDKWYSFAKAWAKNNRISDCENMESNISREDFAVFLYRYAKYRGSDVKLYENTDICHYSDFYIASEDAMPAIKWAVGSGVIKGNTKITLNLKDYTTRAEAATMILNYLDRNEN